MQGFRIIRDDEPLYGASNPSRHCGVGVKVTMQA